MTTPVDLSTAKSQLTQIMDSIDLGPTQSVQFKFAKLQMAQAQLCKDQANDYMNQIENIQQEQKKTAEMIAAARKLQNEAKTGDKCTTMPEEMKSFFKERGLSWDTAGNDDLHTKDEWDYNIQSLTNYQESISNKTQTLMVYLQDFIGQYNSYTQGASNQVSQGIQTLTAVATAR